MDLACQCQISTHPTAIISALIVKKELPSIWGSTAEAMLRISGSPDNYYIEDEMPQKFIMFVLFHDFELGNHYWEFLCHPNRCGVLHNERAKCYTRIMNFWLLFLESPPHPKGPNSLYHEVCRDIVLVNWSRCLSKCLPGDKDLVCRLRDFTLDKARKEDVERVIAWLEVSLRGYWS